MTLHPKIIVKDGKKRFAVLPYAEFIALRDRLSDAEDLLALHKAKRTEGGKPSITLAKAKRLLLS